MSKLSTIVAVLILALPVFASENNPAECWCSENVRIHTPASDGVTGYTSHSSWFSAAGSTTTTIFFESIPSGTVITTELASDGIAMVTGESGGGVTVDQTVLSSAALPFPMFTVGTLPTEPNFLSNDLASPFYGTGSVTFELNHNATAIGAYIADKGALGDFCIEVFDGATSLGTITVAPRELPDSFVGVVSDTAFDKAVFYAFDIGDSWGLDNLELNDSGSALEAGTWAAIKTAVF